MGNEFMTETRQLPIYAMDTRHPGLPPGVAGSYEEAVRVCLSLNYESPQIFLITHDAIEHSAEVEWESPDQRCQRGWANLDDATRDGAYACALAAVELTSGFFAMGRAEKLTGADYYVAPIETDPNDLESCIRLEVSGTQSDINEVIRRLREKITQAKNGNSPLPAIAAVVGFRTKCIKMESVEI
jgi:hypothetical protein